MSVNPKGINSQTEVDINGNMHGNIIVGNRNQINLSSQTGENKVASELAIQRLKEEGKSLRKSCWEFIVSDLMRESPSLIAMIAGKGKPYGRWFYNTLSTFPNFTINGEKVKQTIDQREISEIIWNMSSQELQQVIDYLPSRWKGKDLEEIMKFGEKVLDYAKKIEQCRSELKRQKSIVQS